MSIEEGVRRYSRRNLIGNIIGAVSGDPTARLLNREERDRGAEAPIDAQEAAAIIESARRNRDQLLMRPSDNGTYLIGLRGRNGAIEVPLDPQALSLFFDNEDIFVGGRLEMRDGPDGRVLPRPQAGQEARPTGLTPEQEGRLARVFDGLNRLGSLPEAQRGVEMERIMRDVNAIWGTNPTIPMNAPLSISSNSTGFVIQPLAEGYTRDQILGSMADHLQITPEMRAQIQATAARLGMQDPGRRANGAAGPETPPRDPSVPAPTPAPNYTAMSEAELRRTFEQRLAQTFPDANITADGNYTAAEQERAGRAAVTQFENSARRMFPNLPETGALSTQGREMMAMTEPGRAALAAYDRIRVALAPEATREQVTAFLQAGDPRQPGGPAPAPAATQIPEVGSEHNARRWSRGGQTLTEAQIRSVIVPQSMVGQVQQLLINAHLDIGSRRPGGAPDEMWGPATQAAFERLLQEAHITTTPVDLRDPNVMRQLTEASQRLAQAGPRQQQSGQAHSVTVANPPGVELPEGGRSSNERVELPRDGGAAQAQQMQQNLTRELARNDRDDAGIAESFMQDLARRRPELNVQVTPNRIVDAPERTTLDRLALTPEGREELQGLITRLAANNTGAVEHVDRGAPTRVTQVADARPIDNAPARAG